MNLSQQYINSTYFNIETYNQISFSILNELFHAFHDCEDVLYNKQKSRYFNLISIFIHNINKLLCNHFFSLYDKSSVDSIRIDHKTSFSCEGTVTNNYVSAFSCISEIARNSLRWFLKKYYMRPAQNAKWLLVTSRSSISLYQIISLLNQKAPQECWRIMNLDYYQGWIPEVEKQWEVLSHYIKKLPAKINVAASGLDGIDERIKNMVFRHLTCIPGKLSGDVFLAGSLSILENRVPAAMAKAAGIPVVSIWHGDSMGVHDEPIFGYGESTFADVIIGYGEKGCEEYSQGRYTKSLYDDPITVIPSSSDKARHLFNGKPIPRLSELSEPRFMYLPTMFSGNDRYGPFRDLPDLAYYEWQRRLLACFAEHFPQRIIWKGHAKDKTKVQLTLPGVTVISKPFFEEVMGQADVYVFDYISTAFSLAAATCKPIIYFDIGLRNLTERARQAVKNRCLYIEADPRRPREAFEQALAQADKHCVNEYTPEYSLTADLRPRIEVIAEAILRQAGMRSSQAGHEH